ncbi:MAG: hypothetical protein KDA45_15180, partial [Planctomycetales bacterium]|nr:hypothetical protein [Planctomycetales bacterium]
MSKSGLEGYRETLFAVICGVGMMLSGPGATRSLAQDTAGAEIGLERSATQAELTRLAEICDSLGLRSQAELSRSWMPAERRDCRILFLPTELPRPLPDDANQAHWARHFAAVRAKYAAHLFAQAEQYAQAGDEAAAYRLLCHVLREDPNHAAAKRILGPLVTAVEQRPRIRRATVPHPEFGWPAGSYSRVETPHFSIVTRAEPKSTLALAEQMEVFLALWRQVFFPLWAPPGQLSERFLGRYRSWEKPSVMEVYLLRDRAEYLKILGVAEAD